MSKVKWNVRYMRHKETYEDFFDTVEEAFKFVEEMENGPGGYAFEIGDRAGYPSFIRRINESEGVAYWTNFATGDSFVEYRG